jgi:hypothetical protein
LHYEYRITEAASITLSHSISNIEKVRRFSSVILRIGVTSKRLLVTVKWGEKDQWGEKFMLIRIVKKSPKIYLYTNFI